MDTGGGSGAPDTISAPDLAAPRPDPQTPAATTDFARAVAGRVLSVPERPSHQRIINVYGSWDAAPEPNLGACIADELKNPQEPKGVASPEPPPQVFYFRLSPQVSIPLIVRHLYRAFGFDATRLADLERRPNLASDLEPLRRALTVHRAVVIFDGWDNIEGPFAALHEFLCNTNLGEFLRVLAQPHMPTLQSPGGLPLQLVLLVISARKAEPLSPWVHFEKVPADLAPPDGLAREEEASTLAPFNKSPADLDRLQPPPERVPPAGFRPPAGFLSELLPIVALRFIAVGVDGMRRGTLGRCLDEWARTFCPGRAPPRGSDGSEAFGKPLKEILDNCKNLVTTFPDRDAEGLSPVQRAVELDRRPRLAVNPKSLKAELPVADEVVAFVSSRLRSRFVAQWIESDPEDRSICSWSRINLILSGETLMQTTAALRHLSLDSSESPYTLRRMAQAVFHGLNSLRIQREHFASGVVSEMGFYGPLLPVDPDKRYRFLYNFLYRRVIEGGEARLARSFGRPDLRFDLLKLFVYPQLGSDMLTGLSTAERIPLWSTDPRCVTQHLKSESWCDVVEALGRAARELGARENRAVSWALAMLPPPAGQEVATLSDEAGSAQAALSAKFPHLWADYERAQISALKLRIDWSSRDGTEDLLQDAERHCWEQLRRFGVDKSLFFHLGNDLFGLYEKLRHGREDLTGHLRGIFQRSLPTLKQTLRTPERLQATAAILFRLGEIVATRADSLSETLPRDQLRKQEIAKFGEAGALYWVADRIRSEAGALPDIGIFWPTAGARSMRYYVRVVLKLARLLAEEGSAMVDNAARLRAQEFTELLLEHAQNRIGVYVRNEFRLKRERDSLLMLESARIRTACRINIEREVREFESKVITHVKNKQGHRDVQQLKSERDRWQRVFTPHDTYLRSQWLLLQFCWTLLQDAESNLFTLGFQAAHTRRLYLERVTVVAEMVRVAQAYGAAGECPPEDMLVATRSYLRLAEISLQALKEAAGDSPAWQRLARKRDGSLQRAKKAWSEIEKQVRGHAHPIPRSSSSIS